MLLNKYFASKCDDSDFRKCKLIRPIGGIICSFGDTYTSVKVKNKTMFLFNKIPYANIKFFHDKEETI